MFRAKKFRNRHIILKTLEEHYRINQLDRDDWITYGLFFPELVSKSNLTEQEVNEQLHCLTNEKEVVDEELRHLEILYIISPAGIAAFYDNKYLTLGRKEFLDKSYDILKNISTAILLLFAIVTFIANLIGTNKNQEEIENLKEEIEQLKEYSALMKTSNAKPQDVSR